MNKYFITLWTSVILAAILAFKGEWMICFVLLVVFSASIFLGSKVEYEDEKPKKLG